MSCPECGREDSMEIEINLQEGAAVQFYSCRHCETKWWIREGTTITLDEVLDLATKRDR
ncbi:MAG TPA: hypothetical protein VM573_10220 [Actinomycetota bacterium]|nr:hypothetical protein [Actinomycetota bacterium]